MFSDRLMWTVAGLTGVVLALGGQSLRAGDNPSEQVLANHGLKQAGSLFVLKEESEVRDKLDEARRLGRQLSYALMQQRGSLSPKEYHDTVKQLNDQINQLRIQLNGVNQQIRGLQPQGYGRFRRGYVNNFVAEQVAELRMAQSQLQGELNQSTSFLSQLKSQPSDERARQKIEDDVRDRRESYHAALVELRGLVDATNEKYAGLVKNDEVKKALDALGRTAKTKPKLGPSRGFLTNVKTLEKLEKERSPGETGDSSAKPAQKGRRLTKGKRSTKAAAAPGDSGNRS
jgi:hypothetical protein